MALQVDAWNGKVVTMEMDPVNVCWLFTGSLAKQDNCAGGGCGLPSSSKCYSNLENLSVASTHVQRDFGLQHNSDQRLCLRPHSGITSARSEI